MGNAIRAVRIYVADMLAATRSMIAPIAAQSAFRDAQSPDVQRLFARILETLNAHAEELSEHLRRLGGDAALPEKADGNLATGLLGTASHALAGKRSFAKALRDDYATISLAHAGALMLETNARALGFSSTAALATRHREELANILRGIHELLPTAIKDEVTIEADRLSTAV